MPPDRNKTVTDCILSCNSSGHPDFVRELKEVQVVPTHVMNRYMENRGVAHFFITKPTRCTNFPNLLRHQTLYVSGSSSAFHQEFIHCTLGTGMSYRFADSFRAGPGWKKKEIAPLILNTPDEVFCKLHTPAAYSPGGGGGSLNMKLCVPQRRSSWALEKRKIPCSCRDWNPGPSIPQPVARPSV